MKKVFERIFTWFKDTFQDDRTEDWYHRQIVDSVVARYRTKDKLKEELSNIIDSLQQEQPEVDLEKDFEKEIDKTVNECTNGYDFDWEKFARHFYELGKNSK